MQCQHRVAQRAHRTALWAIKPLVVLPFFSIEMHHRNVRRHSVLHFRKNADMGFDGPPCHATPCQHCRPAGRPLTPPMPMQPGVPWPGGTSPSAGRPGLALPFCSGDHGLPRPPPGHCWNASDSFGLILEGIAINCHMIMTHTPHDNEHMTLTMYKPDDITGLKIDLE